MKNVYKEFMEMVDWCGHSFNVLVDKSINGFCWCYDQYEKLTNPIFAKLKRKPKPSQSSSNADVRSAEVQLDALLWEGDRVENVPDIPSRPAPPHGMDNRERLSAVVRPPAPSSPPPGRLIDRDIFMFSDRTFHASGSVPSAQTTPITGVTATTMTQPGLTGRVRSTRLTGKADKHCGSCTFGYKDNHRGDDITRCWCPHSEHYTKMIVSFQVCDRWLKPPIKIPPDIIKKTRNTRIPRKI